MNEELDKADNENRADVAEQPPQEIDEAVEAEVEEIEDTAFTPPPLPRRVGPFRRLLRFVGTCILLGLLGVAGYGGWGQREELTEMLFPTAPLGVAYMVTESLYTGSDITEDGADFTASFKMNIFQRKGWKSIPLVPSNVAIKKASLPKGAHLYLADGMYCMLTRQSGEIAVSVDYSILATEKDGTYLLTFVRVPSVSCTLKAGFPVEDLDVEVDGAQSIEITRTNGTTEVVAALPDSMPVKLSWEQALPKIEEGPSKYYSGTKTLLSIHEGLVLGSATIDFTILHTPTRELKLNVPVGVSVLEVTGAQILDWRVTDNMLSIQLEKEVIGPYPLKVQYESPVDALADSVIIPVITGAGVVREKGDIGVVSLTNLEVKNSVVKGAHAIDVKDLPGEITGMTTQPMLLAYRYTSPDFEIALEINKHKDVGVLLTIIDNVRFTVMQTHDGKRITRAVYSVRNNGNQFLRMDLPEGAELWSASVAHRATQPARDESGRLLLPLARSQAAGKLSSFPVELVYAETDSAPDERGYGKAKIEMPVCAEPVMHMMLTLYAPSEGRYANFGGTLRRVDGFTSIKSGGTVHAAGDRRAVNAINQALANRKTPSAATANPVEVRLPVSGTVFHFEKILVLKDSQWVAYTYKGLKP